MSGKNDRIILAGMIVLGVIFIALVGAAIGIGTFIYMGGPTASPTPAPTLDARAVSYPRAHDRPGGGAESLLYR